MEWNAMEWNAIHISSLYPQPTVLLLQWKQSSVQMKYICHIFLSVYDIPLSILQFLYSVHLRQPVVFEESEQLVDYSMLQVLDLVAVI